MRSKENGKAIRCNYCGKSTFAKKETCSYCGRELNIRVEKMQEKERYNVNDNSSVRNVYFYSLSDSDDVVFCLDRELIGRITKETDCYKKRISSKKVTITMKYGLMNCKRGYLVLPEDRQDYYVYGGSPNGLIHKLCAVPAGILDGYIDSIYKDLLKSKMVKLAKNISIRNYYLDLNEKGYKFVYDTGYDGTGYKKIIENYSAETQQMFRSLQIDRRIWNEYGYMICVQRIICSRLKQENIIDIGVNGYQGYL